MSGPGACWAQMVADDPGPDIRAWSAPRQVLVAGQLMTLEGWFGLSLPRAVVTVDLVIH